MRRTSRCLAAACAWLVAAGAAFAQTSPQRLAIIVGTPPGGGYDAYARLVGRHIGDFLPGKPSIAVQNMPGAGSLTAANWLANSAPKDGSAIAVVPNAIVFEALLGNRNAHFDARKLVQLGSLNDYTALGYAWRDAPVKSARELLTTELLIGASAANSNNSVLPNLLNALAGTKFRIVNGYPGSAGVDLALERGEVKGVVGPDWDFVKATRAGWLKEGKINVLVQAALTRHGELPDVPTVMELAPRDNQDVLALLVGRQTFGGVFLAPPDSQPGALAALRQAFGKMIDDPEFRQDAQRSSLTLNPTSGDEVTAAIGRLLATPPAVIERATAELRRIDPL